jgi:hypothetical protein
MCHYPQWWTGSTRHGRALNVFCKGRKPSTVLSDPVLRQPVRCRRSQDNLVVWPS